MGLCLIEWHAKTLRTLGLTRRESQTPHFVNAEVDVGIYSHICKIINEYICTQAALKWKQNLSSHKSILEKGPE